MQPNPPGNMKGRPEDPDSFADKNQLDATAGLTMGPACSIDLTAWRPMGRCIADDTAAITGYPHITVPAGLV